MTSVRRLAQLSLAVASLTLALAGPAWGKECDREARVTKGTVLDLTRGHFESNGSFNLDGAKVDELAGGPTYLTDGKATLKFQGVTYRMMQETIFRLGCFGHSRAEGAVYPSIYLMMGSASVRAQEGKPGGISTNEALVDPYLSKRGTFRLTRTGKGNPSAAEVLRKGPGVLLLGTSKARKVRGEGYLNITPYVGPRSGTCRQATGGTLTSRGVRGRFLEGTSSFSGLAPFRKPATS